MTEIVQNEWQNKEWECFNDIGNCKLISFANKTVINFDMLLSHNICYDVIFIFNVFSKAALDIAVHYV